MSSATTEKRRLRETAVRLFAQLAILTLVCICTFAFSGTTRTAFFVASLPLAMMSFCYWLQTSSTAGEREQLGIFYFFTICFTNAAFLVLLYAYRWHWNPDAFYGAVPQEICVLFHSIVGGLMLVCPGLVYFAFTRSGRFRRWRWVVFATMACVLLSLGVATQKANVGFSPSALLNTIQYYESQDALDRYSSQELSSLLAACGRYAESEAISDQVLSAKSEKVVLPSQTISLDELSPRPWQQVIAEIAKRERLVIIMEAHNAPKHRQWIEQVLRVLHRDGFQDYAAEALGRPARVMTQRGYPTSSSGYYTRDPAFGNLLRTALELEFRIHPYESSSSEPAMREYEQAKNIAECMARDPKRKFVVHAGYGHVYKTPDEFGNKLMAHHLWKMTGIEPYCIYQTWHSPIESEALQLSELIGDDDEPVVLIPPPSDMLGGQLRFPAGAVDALVVHSPHRGGTKERSHCFPNQRQRVTGEWLGKEWPVLIGAFKLNESPDAIALDQLMLREKERDFVLWLPDTAYEIRVFHATGEIKCSPDLLRIEKGIRPF